MANVIIILKVMPESPESDLDKIKESATAKITEFGGEVGKVEEEPIAFGLKAINFVCVMDESKGGTEELEKNISELEGVNSVEVTDVRRAIG